MTEGRRRGRFIVTVDALNDYETMCHLMRDVVVHKTDVNFSTLKVVFWAECKYFELVGPGTIVPLYEAEMYTAGRNAAPQVRWKKKQHEDDYELQV